MIRFGPMSIVLLLGAVQGAFVAIGLVVRASGRQDRKLLALLLALLSLKLVPYVIGFAGFYAAYPWLDLAPFDLSLGFGPLLFLFVRDAAQENESPRWRWHLAPLAIQLATYLILFFQPLRFKDKFEGTIGPTFNHAEAGLTVISFVLYGCLAWQVFLSYRRGLAVSQRQSLPIRGLISFLLGVSLVLLSFGAAKVWGWVAHPLSYFQMFPLYVGLTVLVYAFGFFAIPFSNARYPAAAPPSEDWPTIATSLTEQMASRELWRDSQLSIGRAAEALGTTEARLSRALNAGLGIGFSEWINRCRIDQVVKELSGDATERPILDLAFECGFNSKASFHRWFKTAVGCTPSEFRNRGARTELPY